jgi:ABC-type Mn2+/Zn2+ transport system permease subunit
LSARLWRVVGLSVIIALVGVVGGLAVSFELNTQAGACIVLVLVAAFAVSLALGQFQSRSASSSATS